MDSYTALIEIAVATDDLRLATRALRKMAAAGLVPALSSVHLVLARCAQTRSKAHAIEAFKVVQARDNAKRPRL